MERKKGIQLNQAFGAVLTLVLVAVLVIIAIVIFVELSSSFAGTTSASVSSEPITNISNIDARTIPAAISNCSFGDFVLTAATNTSGFGFTTGNFTTTSAGTILLAAAADPGVNSTNLLINHTYTWGSDACTASDNLTTEFGGYTSLVGLVGTIIFLGLVIGILVMAFAFGGKREV